MSRVARLDALRGLAVLLVMIRHGAPGAAPGAGVVGIVMFFTLSGYLITGLLMRELDTTGRIRLGAFYRRRAVRLLPALLALVTGLTVVTLVLDPLGDRSALGRTLAVALTYTADLPITHGSDAIFHLWTLAVEQQFYLLWPPLLAWAWLRGRATLLVIRTLAVIVVVAAGVTLWLREDFDRAYPWPTSWAGAMLIGAAASVSNRRRNAARGVAHARPHRGASSRTLAATAAPVALALLVVAGLVPWRSWSFTYPWVGLSLAALTVVVLHHWAQDPTPQGRALTTLGRLGTISYAAYLWNYPLTLWLRPWHPITGPALAAVLTLALATVSWFLIERPATRRWAGPRPVAPLQ
ncbi:acyltransferase family protein [Streptomyces gamaensis]|uniref:Acyltransferase family protein n=1 Tax=Streptomyces gamaensis TaxID=1763542 RepID=A0ABW0YX09_9ACTN